MEDIKKFIVDNSSQIWTLISVIIGGLVTYISTSATEKRKNKRQSQKENMEQVLVPYCTSLEKTIFRLEEIYKSPSKISKKDNFLNWITDLKKPLEYLEAAKRVYLSKSTRAKLQKYKDVITNFDNTIEQECSSCLIKYKHYIASKLQSFPNLPAAMEILFSMSEVTESKTKVAILTKQDISLIDDFTCIDFIQNDDPENYRNTSITINDNIKNSWGAINYGVMDISDLDNPEDELACILLDFIYENITNEKSTLNAIIDETCSADMLRGIAELLNEMQKDILRTIDKITK